MKKFLKVFLVVVIIAAMCWGGFFVYKTFFQSKKSIDAFAAIPEDAIFIVETTNLMKAWSDISSSDLWQYLMQTSYFSDVNKDIEKIDKYIKSNSIASTILKNRKLIMSAHMISAVGWDFLFTIDLKEAARTIGSLESAIGLIDGYTIDKKEFKPEKGEAYEIIQLTNEEDKNDKIFISFVDNVILVSFTGVIIERAILQKEDKHWDFNKKFQEVMTELGARKLFKVYFNFSLLGQFSKSFLTEEDETMKMLSESLAFAIFDINIKGKKLSLEGLANIDSTTSYVKALADVEPGKMRAYEILTDQTAAFVSICFSNYKTFHNNLLNQYRKDSPEDVEEIEGYIKKVNKIFNIDIDKDLFGWIGQEISVFKIRPMDAESREEDIVIAINATDIDDAKTGLDHITRQVRRRTGIKFDEIEYKNYKINHLAEKGLINVILGKFMEGIDKPYFTYIEDYVIFSNSLSTVMQVVDDYIAGKTMSHSKEFQSFIDNFSPKSNISVFIQMPKMYTTLYYYTPEKSRADFDENKEMILSFARIGFQLVSTGKMFKTTLLAEYDENALADDEVNKLLQETTDDGFGGEIDSMSFKIEIPIGNLETDGAYKEYFDDDSTEIKIEGAIQDNKINGLWRTYYSTGHLRSSVNYKDGKIDGIAYFYYNDEVNSKRAEITYEQDQIIGFYLEFYDNGAQKSKIEYKKGERHGKGEYYYKTGRIKRDGKFKNGLEEGKWKFYNEAGEVIKKVKYKKGVMK